ncbi:hypothetical protein FOH24_13660 [Acetobacter tropicalis]|uniref:Uncharacterized protein n=1 Tax=Acetobacter tropicalis TaxID=104102 RepID=A0A094YHZ3_9PROT|nr:hypothetical protein [Acetobacter tropicalis]KAA8387320.1 hypothetical protein FOH24_13660 [Acetobacter tropicalis]KAA8387567.1 hypothetical protein FOH22_09635 [Acetobacter tropicalis]KGB20957.1 hypothetical protein AtDm6_3322 [Acetobacter tropicalis]KXV57344.1 hypothetical protein AD947_08920 [Acetobacter tropicalis]MBC9010147.1 hypothetical protein [Acetobacter tropicalis]
MKQALVTGGKISGIVALVPLLVSEVPAPWDTVLCTIVIICGAIATAVPAPQTGSGWMMAYKLVSVIGLNFGWAANHLAAGQHTVPQPQAPDTSGKARQ